MYKRVVKIVILFILLIVLIAGGYYVYKQIEDKKEHFAVSIYDYVSPRSIEVINISKKFELDKLLVYDTTFHHLVNAVEDDILFPAVVSKYSNEQKVLMARYITGSERDMKAAVSDYASSSFTSRKEYKNAEILFYTLGVDSFIVCTFYKGLFVISGSFQAITAFVDSDIENSYFGESIDKEPLYRLLDEPLAIFYTIGGQTMALRYNAKGDTIYLDGYILSNRNNDNVRDKTGYDILPYRLDLPDNVCIDSCEIDTSLEPTSVKLTLNKMPEIMLNK